MTATQTKFPKSLRIAQSILLFGIAALCGGGVIFSVHNSADQLIVRVGFSLLLISISIWDFRTRTVSFLITSPWMLVSIARAFVEHDPTFIFYWLGIFLIWNMNFFGGGDAKLQMGLFGLFPDTRLLWITCAVLILTALPVLIFKYVRISPRMIVASITTRFTHGHLLPTDEELNHGVPFAFAYCLAGGIYLWLFT